MKRHALVLAVMAVGTQAHAQSQPQAQASDPFYVTAAGGITRGGLDCASTVACDNSGGGAKVIFGQHLGYGISAELGVATLGKFPTTTSTTSKVGTTTTKVTTDATRKPTAILLGAAYTLPLGNNWGVKARLGVAQVKTKTNATTATAVTTTTTTTTTAVTSGTDSKTRAYIGAGLTYAVNNAINVELGVDSIGAAMPGQGAARMVTLGATYTFGGKWGGEDETPAQGEGFYATAAGGVTSGKSDCPGTTSCDTKDTGLKLVGGYQFNHGLGLEVAYLNFGKFGAVVSNVPYTVKPTALVLNGALAVPLNGDFGVKVRLGYAQVRSQNSATSAAKTESKPKVYYGLAATYAINKSFKAEIGADSTEADVGNQKPTIRLYSAGVTYAF